MYSSILIGQYILSVGASQHVNLNMTQIQKMLYIAYGYFLAQDGKLLVDETPKAWPYGPVFPKVHKKVKLNEPLAIDSKSFNELQNDSSVTSVIHDIVSDYKQYSATQLSNWSHKEGGPWHKTTQDEGFNWNAVIPNEYIIEYFKDIKVF